MIKKLLCLIGLHDWKYIEIKVIRFETVTSGYETTFKCNRCQKEMTEEEVWI